jgi:uncharacterized protein YegP (UPF0339 family)
MVERILFRRADGKWAWQLIVNGNVVATDGGQGYASQDEAGAMADKVVGGEYKDAVPRTV